MNSIRWLRVQLLDRRALGMTLEKWINVTCLTAQRQVSMETAASAIVGLMRWDKECSHISRIEQLSIPCQTRTHPRCTMVLLWMPRHGWQFGTLYQMSTSTVRTKVTKRQSSMWKRHWLVRGAWWQCNYFCKMALDHRFETETFFNSSATHWNSTRIHCIFSIFA